MTSVKFIPREPAFSLWETVSHAAAPAVRGIITAFMQRGTNYSYEVSWGIEKCLWHMEEELCPLPVPNAIGFNPPPPSSTCESTPATPTFPDLPLGPVSGT